MSRADYLRLLDWTGRRLRRDKRGAIPSDVAPILHSLKITDEVWLHLVTDVSRLFRRAAGTSATFASKAHHAERDGYVDVTLRVTSRSGEIITKGEELELPNPGLGCYKSSLTA